MAKLAGIIEDDINEGGEYFGQFGVSGESGQHLKEFKLVDYEQAMDWCKGSSEGVLLNMQQS